MFGLGIITIIVIAFIAGGVIGAWLIAADGVTGMLAHIRIALIATATGFGSLIHGPVNSAAVTPATPASK